jgi:CBS domain-containing protein
MARTDIHLDETLRHLGAAYYDSLRGRASRSDVTRALEAVEEHLRAQQRQAPGGVTAPVGVRRGERGQRVPRTARHVPRVRDVMTKKVVTVDRLTTYSEIVRLLTERRISGVPVLTMGRHVAGVVSEADLVAAEDTDARQARIAAEARTGRHLPWRRAQRPNLTAGSLMTSPAITINPDATVPRAAREMHTHRVRRLPVVDEGGKLLGIVSRRDLLSVFLRPDTDVADDVRELLDDFLPSDPASVTATVKDGVVVLTGRPQAPEDRQLIPVAIRLIWDVDGVIDVENRLGQQAGADSGEPGLLLSAGNAGEQDGQPGAASPPEAATPPEPGDASSAAER